MTEQIKSCRNCVHRTGFDSLFWRCSRVGLYVSTEMIFGGICAKDDDLRMWSQRPSLRQRVINVVRELTS